MAQNLLKELLQQEQEPFHLKDYITNKKQKHKKPLTRNHPSSSFLCKNACFFSIQNSPNVTKSPLLLEPTKTQCKSHNNNNRMFLNVPSRTASLLLEAAIRIQKQSKPAKKRVKNSGFGLFGSVLKRLTSRKGSSKEEEKNRSCGIVNNNNKLKSAGYCPSCCSLSSSSSSLSSSYSTCSSSWRSVNVNNYDDEFVFSYVLKDNNGGGGGSLSPFRVALRSSPSPELRSPPVKSPIGDNVQDNNVKFEQERQVGKFEVEDDEEDEEQNSPVSVLDPPFEDDDYEGHKVEGYDLQYNYTFVQRAKHNLFHKLQRFEKLAELDPIELEKSLIEDELDYKEECKYESFNFDEETKVNIFIMDEIIAKLGFQDIRKPGIQKLISDLIIHEEIELEDKEKVIKRVCKSLESWNEVEDNTIDMMVGMDLRREIGDWKNYKEQIDEIAKELEVALFATLVDEMVIDLSSY